MTFFLIFIFYNLKERRRSLRRDTRKINWKKYFTYDEDENDDNIEFQLRTSKTTNKKKSSSSITKIKRENDESSHIESMPQRERKKIKIEDNSIKIQTPFDNDLLKPIFYESEEFEDNCDGPSYASSSIGGYGIDNNDSSSRIITENDDNENEKIIENIIIKENISSEYHCRSKYINFCLLCGKKIQHAVLHYVNEHPNNEVIISRITQQDFNYILNNKNLAFIVDQKTQVKSDTNRICQYTALCLFCNRDMKFALNYWWEHFTMHTGEYSYECTGCKIKRPRKQSLKSHIKNLCNYKNNNYNSNNKKRKINAKIHEIYKFDKSISEIHAYVCTLCYYIKLHHFNLEQHLIQQHHKTLYELSEYIVKITLIQFAGGNNSNNNHSSSSSSNNRKNVRLKKNNDNNTNTTEVTAVSQSHINTDFMEYSNDDLSFMICNMLANVVPEIHENVNNSTENLNS